MVPRRRLQIAIAIGLMALVALLVAFFVVGALAWLLGAMGDAAGQAVLGRIALALGTLLAIDLVLMVLAQALAALDDPRPPPEE